MKSESEVTQSCPVDTVDCSLPGSSLHGILQARILEWVAIPFSRGSSQPRYRTLVSCIAGGFFTIWATWEALLKNRTEWSNSGSDIQNGARWPLWIWFQTCSCITENFSFLNCIRLKDIHVFLKTISASICQQQPYGLTVSPCNKAVISNPSQSLLLISTVASCQFQS